MLDWFESLHPVYQGLLATLFTYFVTALGAACVFFFVNVNQKVLDMMMGFAAGVMIAASFWSLIAPAIELSEKLGSNAWLTAAIGFATGGIFTIGAEMFLSRAEFVKRKGENVQRSILLSAAVTLHNIPEGLAIGVAFGCASLNIGDTSLIAALMLALGVGIQNFPEGMCVAMPLRRDGNGRMKSFLIGQASGLVEPIAGVCGVIAALSVRQFLPFALTFSAGAMISVVCSELIPEAFRENKNLASMGVLTGFIVMMVLDVALG